MKKAAVAAVGAAAVIAVLFSVSSEKSAAPLKAYAINEDEQTDSTEASAETEESAIDTSLPVQEGARIAVVSKETKGEFWSLIRSGMEAAVNDVNEAYDFDKNQQISMSFEGPDDEQEVEEQINTLDAVIAENPDVLCLSVGDMNSCQAQLEAAWDNGIPVITFDSNVSDQELISSFHGTDNEKVGELAAEHMEEVLGGSGKVAVFSEQQKTQTAVERTESFLNRLPDDIVVEEVIYADQVEDMKAAMEAVLTIHPDLDGVFCTNADITETFLNLEKNTEKTIAVIGVDATAAQVKAISEGTEVGVISQNPYKIGYDTMMDAIMATVHEQDKAGNKTEEPAEKPEEASDLQEPVWLDQTNLEEAQYADYIYSK
jgi:ribose transport system substrate-binding protein